LLKYRASKQSYTSPLQQILLGFETPFAKELNPDNRWVKLAHIIPWDSLVSEYRLKMNNSRTGADGINPRVAIGSIIIKHMCDLSDRETVLQIQENMYMQYFIGFSSFSNEEPFDASLFVEFRKRMDIDYINKMNEKILGIKHPQEAEEEQLEEEEAGIKEEQIGEQKEVKLEGQLILDATACPQDISYPTDLNLLNTAREKLEELIDYLYESSKEEKKPRTYRVKARKEYLKIAQKKVKRKKEIRAGIRKQLGYVSRDMKHIDKLIERHPELKLDKYQNKYLLVIKEVWRQQKQMYDQNIHSIENRIVSLHQAHVRPIVRGKTNANVEFGAKIHVSLMNGYAFLDDLSWDAYNEGKRLIGSVEKYHNRFGHYPESILVDKIYCTRENRAWLKEKGITLRAKPLGRPKAVTTKHVSPGERNPIEGKFGQAKTTYGMNRIKARLKNTSESWIATIILVLNLVKLAGQVPYYMILRVMTYSASYINTLKRYLKHNDLNISFNLKTINVITG